MSLSLPARKLVIFLLISAAILIAGGIILCFTLKDLSTADILPIILGVLLSSLVNILKVFMLEHQVKNVSKMDDPNKAKLSSYGNGILRFLLTGGGLVAAYFIHFVNLYAAIAGTLAWNLSVYALKFARIGEEDSTGTL